MARSLGEFFGHIWHAVKTDPSAQAGPTASRTRVEQEHRETPLGPVVIRRTVIEEVHLPPGAPIPQPPPQSAPHAAPQPPPPAGP